MGGLQSTMIKWFTSNPTGSATCLPMVLSTFSHYSLFHLGCNMVALHSFMGAAVHGLGMFATIHPDSTLQIIFLPMVKFTAATGLKALVTIDTLGLLLRWRMFDHAAHLAGLGFGVAWCYLGNPLLWVGLGGQLVAEWHNAKERRSK